MIAGPARWRVLGLLLFIALAEALVIVALPYFATADGPTHIADAVTLTQYGSPGHAVYSHYYTLSYFPVPNLSTVLLLVALVRLVSPNVAEKIMICGYIFGLPLALLYAVRSVRLDSGWPAFLAFPLTFTLTLQVGLYNFAYSVVTFLVTVGFRAEHRLHAGCEHVRMGHAEVTHPRYGYRAAPGRCAAVQPVHAGHGRLCPDLRAQACDAPDVARSGHAAPGSAGGGGLPADRGVAAVRFVAGLSWIIHES